MLFGCSAGFKGLQGLVRWSLSACMGLVYCLQVRLWEAHLKETRGAALRGAYLGAYGFGGLPQFLKPLRLKEPGQPVLQGLKPPQAQVTHVPLLWPKASGLGGVRV